MTAAKKKQPPTRSAAFIMSVGALVNALVMLAGYLLKFPAEFYPLAAAVVGASLAVWRTGVGLGGNKGYTRIEIMWSALVGCVMLAIFVAMMAFVTQCGGVVTKDNPKTVTFDVNRTTCKIWVDVDGKRVFEVHPGLSTKCNVVVE